jgi:hypothetical protein
MRCPACRARLKEQTECPRCSCDLGRVFLASEQAEHCITRAIQGLLDQQPMAAAQAVKRGFALQHSDLLVALSEYIVTVQQQRAIIHLHAGHPGAARAALEVAMTLQTTPLMRALMGFIAHHHAR